MRVLLATESYFPNVDGGAVARRNLAIRLKKKGHDVAVVAPGLYHKNYQEEIDGIKVYRAAARTLPLYFDYKFCVFPLSEVKRVIREFQPNVIDMNSPYQIGMCALAWGKKEGIPVIGTVHVQPENMLMSVDKAKFLMGMLEKMAWFYIKSVFNRCDYVTSPTKTAIDMLKDNGITASARPISSGIDLNIFKPENDGTYLRDRFNIPQKPVILYTGRISGEKRLDVLVRAMPDVLGAMDAHLVICGSGREKENVEALVGKLGISENVTFTGFLSNDEFPDIYGLADVFAMPSESELQSIVTLEALASGLPVVAANKDALPEIVLNPQNGFLFTPGDEKALSENIITILSDHNLRKEMGAYSLKLVQSHSIENTILRFENLYMEAIDNYKRK